jgi:predicted ester cyclase
MAENDNAATYRAIVRMVSAGELEGLDGVIAPGFVDHSALPDQPAGSAGFAYWARTARAAFPDLDGTVEDVLVDGARIAGRVTWRGTHRGDFVGVPGTGRRVALPAFHIVRFDAGRAVEWWGTADLLGALTQLGVRITPGRQNA